MLKLKHGTTNQKMSPHWGFGSWQQWLTHFWFLTSFKCFFFFFWFMTLGENKPINLFLDIFVPILCVLLLLRPSSQPLQLFSGASRLLVAEPLLLQQTSRQVGRLTFPSSLRKSWWHRLGLTPCWRRSPPRWRNFSRWSIWRQLTTWATRWQSKTADDRCLPSATTSGVHVSLRLFFRLITGHFLRRESVSLLYLYLKLYIYKKKSNEEQNI